MESVANTLPKKIKFTVTINYDITGVYEFVEISLSAYQH